MSDNPHRRADDRDSHDCAYQTGSMRCRFPGSISHGTNGGGPWYCRVHARELGNQIARQCLQESQTYREPRPPEDDLKEFTWLAANFPMRAGETRQAYNLRCRTKSMGAGFEMKRMVNSEPTRMREPGEDMCEL